MSTSPLPNGWRIPSGTAGTSFTDTSSAATSFTPGQNLWLSYFYLATRASGTSTVSIVASVKWYNSSGTLISTTSGQTITIGASVGWTRTTEDLHVPPSGAVSGLTTITVTASVNPIVHDVQITGIRLAPSRLFSTSNTPYVSSTAPTNPTDGDLWTDTSVTPNVLRIRVAGVWQVASTNVTNTNQITDGAGLGTTANWTSVSGRPTTLAALDSASAAAINSLTTDDTLTIKEKQTLSREMRDLESRYNTVLSRATALSLSTTAVTTAYTNFTNLLNSYSPAWNLFTADTTIYTHAFADRLFPTNWTAGSGVTSTPNGNYTTVTDPNTGFASWSRSVSNSGTTTFTAALVVRKDSTPKATRFPLIRIVAGGANFDTTFDTSTGEVGFAAGTTPTDNGSLDLGTDWLIYLSGTTAAPTVSLNIFPAVGGGASLAAYNGNTTGSFDFFGFPLLVLGDWTHLGHYVLTARLKALTTQMESLWQTISAQDASTAAWTGVTGTGKPADNATVGAILGPGGNVSGAVDGNLRPFIDLSQAGHLNRTADNISETTARRWAGVTGAGGITDTRAIDSAPSVYYAKGLGEYQELKNANFSGSGSSGFGALITTVQWGDASGGPVKQYLTDSIGQGFTRVSSSASAWGAWARDYNGFYKPRLDADVANNTMDFIGDGSTYGRPIISRLNGGKPLIDFAEPFHLNRSVGGVNYCSDGSFEKGVPTITNRSDGGTVTLFALTSNPLNGVTCIGPGMLGSHYWAFTSTASFVAKSTTVTVSVYARDSGISNTTREGWAGGGPTNACGPLSLAVYDVTSATWSAGSGEVILTVPYVGSQGPWARYTATITGLTIGHTYAPQMMINPYTGEEAIDIDCLQVEEGAVATAFTTVQPGATFGADMATNVTNNTLTYIGDDANYSRIATGRVNAGRPVIDFSETIHSNKNLDNIGDGGTYVRMPAGTTDGSGTTRRALIDFSWSTHVNKSLANVDGTANTKLGGIQAGATLGADLSSNVTNVVPQYLPATTAAGGQFLFTGAISASVDSSGTNATISVGSGTLYAGTSVSYSAMSATVTGSAGTTVTYYLYVTSNIFTGGAHTLNTTTTAHTTVASPNIALIGSVTITFTANTGSTGGGSGGGGLGGGGCVTADTMLPGVGQAGLVKVGDYLLIANPVTFEPRYGLVTRADRQMQPCVRLTTASGIVLECSTSAPIAVEGGDLVLAPDLLGYRVPVSDHGLCGHDLITTVEPIGDREIVFITCEDDLFWAGAEEGRYLLHHNIKS